MRRIDAPRAGWYPDPESRTSLRWWDGLDWSDVRRAPPSGAEMLAAEADAQFRAAANDFAPELRARSGQSDQIVNQVREVTRAEMDRAADAIEQRTRAAVRSFHPLVTDYTNRALRWVRWLVVIAVLLIVLWFVVRVIAEAAVIDWITDQIDKLNDDENGLALAWRLPTG